jgi:hypothetical protein
MATDGPAKAKPKARRDTRLESEGAEFLVLGQLLIAGIEAHKAYTRYPGYDLVALNPERDKTCRIQVKSRWATDYDGGFLIKNFDCDFVVHVALNRGYSYRRPKAGEDAVKPPVSWVIPAKVAEESQYAASSWGKVYLRDIPDREQYHENWDLIRRFLELPAP